MAKPTKRATKSKQPISVVVSADGGIQGTFTPEPRRPLIAHLPFRTTEIQFQDGPLVYDPRPPVNPEPYDATADDLYASNSELLLTDQTKKAVDQSLPPAISESTVLVETVAPKPVVSDAPIKAFRTMDVMLEYRVGNETRVLPECVSAACFWCAGQFEGRPVVLPTLEENGLYKVYGNFLAGTPVPALGHSDKGGWGLTMFENDDADFYKEKANPANANQVWYKDHWEDLLIRKETIQIKNKNPVF